MKVRLLAGLLCVSLLALASTLCAEPRQMTISLQDAQEVIKAQSSAQDFVYFGKDLSLDELAGQKVLPLGELIDRVRGIASEEKFAEALEMLTKRGHDGSCVAPKKLTQEAVEAARAFLVAHHEQVKSDDELKSLNSQLEFYKNALDSDVLTITVSSERAPRPPLDMGDAASTGNVGESFDPISASGFVLPDDVNIVHNLSVGNDLTVGGNLIINGTVTYHGDVILQPICPDPDIAIRFNTCTGTEIARIYTPSVVGGIVISTDGGTTENFRVQADGNTQVTGTLELPTGYITKGGLRYINSFNDNQSFFAGIEAGNPANVGSPNTGIGYRALISLTNGSANTACGDQTLLNLTSGAQNAAFGSSALHNATTGLSNVAIGNFALGNITTGQNNTALGLSAGNVVTTGNNNLYLGYIENAGSAAESNTIRIGANATLAATQCFIGGIDGTALTNQAKIVGIDNKQLGTTDASGFTLGGILTASNAIYADGGVDRSGTATLSLGTTNANAITIGGANVTGITSIDGTTLNLGNTTATTINMGTTASTDINIGRAGTTTLDILGTTLNVTGTTTAVTGSTTASIDGLTVNVGDTTATDVNIGNGAATVDITGTTITNTGITEIRSGNELRFFNTGNSRYNAIKADGLLGTTTTTLVLPATNGTLNQVLTNDGTGVLSWTTVAGASGFTNGGNSFGAPGIPAVLGTTQDQVLNIVTGATPTIRLSIAGDTGSGAITATPVIYADGGVDRSGATTLNLGTTNATGIAIGTGTNIGTITIGNLTSTGASNTSLLGKTSARIDGTTVNIGNTTATGINIGSNPTTTVTSINSDTALPVYKRFIGNTQNPGAIMLYGYADVIGNDTSFLAFNTYIDSTHARNTNNTGYGTAEIMMHGLGGGTAGTITFATGPGLPAGTAPTARMSITNGNITATPVIYADGGVDRSAPATTLSVGTTNATTVTIGNTGTATMAVELPNGYVTTGGSRYINKFGTTSFFAGLNAGNTQASNAGTANTGVGVNALAAITVGNQNTAVGFNALTTHSGGNGNTALGDSALAASDLCTGNTAIGFDALQSANSVNSLFNTAVGAGAGSACTTGSYNTILGFNANSGLTGTNNIIIGDNSGSTHTGAESSNIIINNAGVLGENNTIRIGTQGNGVGQQNRCFIAGIVGLGAFANPVTLDPATGQLGGVPSSRRYKENIQPLDSQDRFMALNPVSFNYKNDASKSTWYGLIAEEVEPIYPELAVYGKDGQLESVSYLKLDGIIIKELQSALERIKTLEAKLAALEN